MSSTNKWPTVKLGEVAEILMGQAPPSSATNKDRLGYPLIAGAGDFSSTGIEPIKFTNVDARLSEADDIIISIRATIGPFRIADRQYALGRGVAAIRACDKVDNSFLAHYIRYSEPALIMKGRGATFLQISRRDLSGLDVPLPPLAEQQRIAEILDTISSNLASRKTQLEQLSTLQKSTFERFHLAHLDQATKYHFKDVVPRIDSGKSPVCESRPAADNEWGVLKLSAVTTGEFLQDENKAYLEDTESLSHLEIQPGDLLMTRKNTPELVGAVSLVRETRPNLLLPDLIFRLNLNEDLVKPEYLAALLMSPPVRFSIRSLAGGSAKSMSNISKQRLNKLLIDLPPLNAQREFVTKSQEIQAIKRKVNSAYKLDQELLASLQAHAFAGHL